MTCPSQASPVSCPSLTSLHIAAPLTQEELASCVDILLLRSVGTLRISEISVCWYSPCVIMHLHPTPQCELKPTEYVMLCSLIQATEGDITVLLPSVDVTGRLEVMVWQLHQFATVVQYLSLAAGGHALLSVVALAYYSYDTAIRSCCSRVCCATLQNNDAPASNISVEVASVITQATASASSPLGSVLIKVRG